MKKVSFGWMLGCILCVALTFVLCIWKNGDVLAVRTGEKPEDVISTFFADLRTGDIAGAESLLTSDAGVTLQADNNLSQESLSENNLSENNLSGNNLSKNNLTENNLSEESSLLLNALRSSCSCSMSGSSEQKGDTARQTVMLTRLDAASANAAAVSTAKTGMPYADALRTVLADSAPYMTTDILTVNCRIEDGKWKLVPDAALITALQGGLN